MLTQSSTFILAFSVPFCCNCTLRIFYEHVIDQNKEGRPIAITSHMFVLDGIKLLMLCDSLASNQLREGCHNLDFREREPSTTVI